MTAVLTRDAFLTLCDSEAIEDMLTVGHILKAPPAWLILEDTGVAAAVWHTSWRLQRFAMETQAITREQQAKIAGLLEQMAAIRADLDARVAAIRADLDARVAALATAEDDLDVFQAGYDRGYAQGWKHRGERGEKHQEEAEW
jgi:hypothetical protein